MHVLSSSQNNKKNQKGKKKLNLNKNVKFFYIPFLYHSIDL